MKPTIRKLGRSTAVAAVALLSAVALAQTLRAASPPDGMPPMMNHSMPGHDQIPGMMQQHGSGKMPGMHGGHAGAQMHGGEPTLPGQDAFGAIHEIVRMLEADPKTDWSKVDLEALRQHLVDMNDVTLKANAVARPVGGGLEIAITGEGRTVAAIQRMVPAHARELDQTHPNGWSAKIEPLPDGVRLTVTATNPTEVAHIRGLGFIGILVSGVHHQPHHLAMAKREPFDVH